MSPPEEKRRGDSGRTTVAAAPPQIVVLVRRAMARPGAVSEDEVLGRCERAALSAALSIAGPLSAPVTALTLGPARREDRVLAMALRAGCNRAVRVWDDSLDALDYLGLARVLAAAVKRIGGDLVLCGDRSHDEAQGAIGPALAELLAMPHLTGVIDLAPDGGALLAERRADGWHHRYRVTWPAVLCMQRMPARVVEAPAPRPDGDDDDDDSDDEDDTAAAAAAAARVTPPGKKNRRPLLRRRGRVTTPSNVMNSVATPPAGTVTIEELDLPRLDIDPRELSHRGAFAGRVRATRGRSAVLGRDVRELVARLRDDRVLG